MGRETDKTATKPTTPPGHHRPQAAVTRPRGGRARRRLLRIGGSGPPPPAGGSANPQILPHQSTRSGRWADSFTADQLQPLRRPKVEWPGDPPYLGEPRPTSGHCLKHFSAYRSFGSVEDVDLMGEPACTGHPRSQHHPARSYSARALQNRPGERLEREAGGLGQPPRAAGTPTTLWVPATSGRSALWRP